MPGKAKKRQTGCPVAFALDTFGDRWTLIIIRDMVLKGFQTYSQFQGAAEGIATNVLADRLQQLEAEGIVIKEQDPENRRRNLYWLTEKGCDLIPVLLEMILWSARYDKNTIARESIISKIKADRQAFAAELHKLRLRQ